MSALFQLSQYWSERVKEEGLVALTMLKLLPLREREMVVIIRNLMMLTCL